MSLRTAGTRLWWTPKVVLWWISSGCDSDIPEFLEYMTYTCCATCNSNNPTAASTPTLQHRFVFGSSGTQEQVLGAVTETLLTMLSVTSEQLAVTVSSSAGSGNSERRLASTEWQVDYNVTADHNALDSIFLAAADMSADAAALTQTLAQALSSRGLQLEAGSLVLEAPELVGAETTTGAPSPEAEVDGAMGAEARGSLWLLVGAAALSAAF
ncbi:unnamed protein product [Prorocentrum cordatum]|uniref:Uncharacterized protein n=1 Tax=Prorocentrum cordatum TaxID=2364126 RepID=A0ABN9QUV1_9DINO|nr:unnamed protein product [Polarella glacialis]